MALGYALFLIGARPGLWLEIGVTALMIGSAVYVATRPEPKEITQVAE